MKKERTIAEYLEFIDKHRYEAVLINSGKKGYRCTPNYGADNLELLIQEVRDVALESDALLAVLEEKLINQTL